MGARFILFIYYLFFGGFGISGQRFDPLSGLMGDIYACVIVYIFRRFVFMSSYARPAGALRVIIVGFYA